MVTHTPHDGLQRVNLFDGAIVCDQPQHGYRFSVDVLALAAAAVSLPGRRALDLGSGVGILLLALSVEPRFEHLVGVELLSSLAAVANHNAALADVAGRMTVLAGDLRRIDRLVYRGSFDLVVSNPPFFPAGAGRLPPDRRRALARHELCCTLPDVVRAVCYALSPTGRALLLYPAEREGEIELAAADRSMRLARVRPLRARPGMQARQALFELRARSDVRTTGLPVVGPDLILYGGDGRFTGELATLVDRLRQRRPAGGVRDSG